MLMGTGRVGRQTPAGSALLPSLDLKLLSGSIDSRVTFTRASGATDLVYTSASGSPYNIFGTNIPRLLSAGLLTEEQRTNSLLNSGTPATQTTASLATGTYTLWVIGSFGSAISSTGTAVGSGFGTATAGTPNTFTLTSAGTVVVTVTGVLEEFQLENGSFPTSFIVTAGSTATRAADVATMPVGSWFNAAIGTLIVDAMFPQVNIGTNQDLPSIEGSSANDILYLRQGQGSTGISALVFSGNVNEGSTSTGLLTAAVPFKTGFSYNTATKTITAATNGATSSSFTATLMPASMTQLVFGLVRAGNTNGYIRRVQYFPRAMPGAELQQRTA